MKVKYQITDLTPFGKANAPGRRRFLQGAKLLRPHPHWKTSLPGAGAVLD